MKFINISHKETGCTTTFSSTILPIKFTPKILGSCVMYNMIRNSRVTTLIRIAYIFIKSSLYTLWQQKQHSTSTTVHRGKFQAFDIISHHFQDDGLKSYGFCWDPTTSLLDVNRKFMHPNIPRRSLDAVWTHSSGSFRRRTSKYFLFFVWKHSLCSCPFGMACGFSGLIR